MQVYSRVPRSHQLQTAGKTIGTRWLDVNKGDGTVRDYRSRLVGKEFRHGQDDTLYASTPPLEALRAILSYVATHGTGIGDNQRQQGKVLKGIMLNYIKRASFYAAARRDLYIELLKEGAECSKGSAGQAQTLFMGRAMQQRIDKIHWPAAWRNSAL